MTFLELQLMTAVHRAELGGGDPIDSQSRMEVARRVFRTFSEIYQESYFPFDVDAVVQSHYSYRKQKEARVKAEIALSHGAWCFWLHRDKGPCSDSVDAGHLVAKSHGGELSVANCVIECSSHNRQRGNMTVEEYLTNTEMRTDGLPGVQQRQA